MWSSAMDWEEEEDMVGRSGELGARVSNREWESAFPWDGSRRVRSNLVILGEKWIGL